MKLKISLFAICSSSLLTIFLSSCEQEPKEVYPIVYEYQQLSFSPTLWYVLTADAQHQINQPASALGYDDEVRNILESDIAERPFDRMEFLSDSTVKITFTDGINTLDTVFFYTIDQGKTSVHLGQTAEEDIVFYTGVELNILYLGITSTLYSYKPLNGVTMYSPMEFQYSTEVDALNILNALRVSENLMQNDTVAINIAAFVYK